MGSNFYYENFQERLQSNIKHLYFLKFKKKLNRRGISKLSVKITNVVAHLLVENILRHCKLVHLVFYPKMLTEKIVWKYFEFKDVHSLFLPEKNIPF